MHFLLHSCLIMKQMRKCLHSASIYGLFAPLQIRCSEYFVIIHFLRTVMLEGAINLTCLHSMERKALKASARYVKPTYIKTLFGLHKWVV